MTRFNDVWGEPAAAAAGEEQASLSRYLDTIRERRWFVLAATALCVLAAALYAETSSKVYEAHADMLVTPVPADQVTVLGLGLLRAASDPTRDVTTASRVIDNTSVAALVAQQLHLAQSPGSLLQEVSVQPAANTSIVTITASTGSPALSQRIANAFATAAVTERTNQLHQALVPAIQGMREQIRATTGAGPATASTQPLYVQLAAMESLLSGPDPTLHLVTPATLPTGPASPNKKLDILAGLLAGLLIGIGGAFALNALSPRKAFDAKLNATGLAVLARVPHLGRKGRRRAAFDEAFRSLRTMLRFATGNNPAATIAVTSASEQEGKTTTSFQLAMAALEAGQSVLLIEADPARPGLGPLVGAGPETHAAGLLDYLSETADLDAIIYPTAVPDLLFVPAGARQPTSITRLLESERGHSFVSDLAGLADLVILDCPPVGPRSDALLIAGCAQAVLLVVDPDRSSERDVMDAVRRLNRADARLVGMVVNHDASATASYEYREPSAAHAPAAHRLLSRH